MKSLVQIAEEYGIKSHNLTNCKYDGKPYEVHLRSVYETAKKFIHLIPEEYREAVLAACWLHDVIEDCRQTYNDVKKQSNEQVADIAYALTNEKGKNRKERANSKYYKGIRKVHYATFLKICDRIANTEYSKNKGSRMFGVYKEEFKDFKKSLSPSPLRRFYYKFFNKKKYQELVVVNDVLWKYLESLMEG